MFRSTCVVTLSLLGISVAAQAQDASTRFPTEQEQAKAAEPYSECMRVAAERIDDGHTDIAVVGKAVAEACKSEFAQMLTVMEETLSAENRKILRERLSQMQIGIATAAVGGGRLAKRGNGGQR